MAKSLSLGAACSSSGRQTRPPPPPPLTSTSPHLPQYSLDGNDCVSLAAIVESVNIPIDEEQAWAICYQCAKRVLELAERTTIYLVSEMEHVLLARDGSVHEDTFLRIPPGGGRQRASSETKLVENLGAVIYEALDYNVSAEQERRLSSPLNALISHMTAPLLDATDTSHSGHEADEGIEEDGGGPELEMDGHLNTGCCSLNQVLESCRSHLTHPEQSDVHYKAVCRALVTEVLELSTFLQKISSGSQELRQVEAVKELQSLNIRDWARLWVQVIDELRRGVKLKKVEVGTQPIEYALTPYEILMDDIRSRRYKLNKVMVNGDLPPRVKKDAHAIILEFIRSRPPLKPVSKRFVRPVAPQPLSNHERLMSSIRTTPPVLRPVSSPYRVGSRRSVDGPTSRASSSSIQSQRRLIKADTALFNLVNFDEDDESPMTPDVTYNGFSSEQQDRDSSSNAPGWHKTVALDLTKHSQVLKPERRHSITLCDVTPTVSESGSSPPTTSLPAQLPWATTSKPTLIRSMLWKNSLECLSLTLEEVVHIRNVLTKAELENLLAGTHLYDDVAKGKLCFTCKKTKFSFFGPRGQQCRLCRRTVCDKCCSKMRIPTEHFANIPVYTLSPSPTSSGDEDTPTSKFSFWGATALSPILTTNAGSAPSTPLSTPRHTHLANSSLVTDSPAGAAAAADSTAKREDEVPHRKALSRAKTIQRDDAVRQEKLRGSLMNVCRECKSMVCHVIVASRNSLALKHKSGNLSATFPWRIKSNNNSSLSNGNSSTSSFASPAAPLKNRDSITSQFRLNLTPFYNSNIGQQN